MSLTGLIEYNNVGLVLKTAPTVEPATLSETKKQLRLDDFFTDDDAYLTALITAVRAMLENLTGRAFVNQTWYAYYDLFYTELIMPKPPLVSVSSIKYKDGDGVSQTLSAAEYQVNTVATPGRIKPAYGCSWPSIRESDYNPITVEYVCGYGAAASNVPLPLVYALFLWVNHLYENKVPVIVGTIAVDIPFTVSALIAPYTLPIHV